METKDYQKLIEEILRNRKDDGFRIYEKKDDSFGWGDWYERKQVEKEVIISIEDVMKKFKPEELIQAIGIEKVESIIRAHKIKLLKKKIKK